MDEFQLPDGRLPIRFDDGRAAFYLKARGEGEVRYVFSMIKWMRNNRHRLPEEELRRRRKEQADKLLKKNPNFFKEIGSQGGKKGKNDS